MPDHSTETIADRSGNRSSGAGICGELAESLTGELISGYRILDKLGQGGMGVVYRALDLWRERYVAIKFASPKGQTNPALYECLRREAGLGSALNHPNVCAVYDAGSLGERPFMVMELIEGQTLRERIGPLFDLKELLDLGIQICHGLGAVHASGIIHRDIKPSNIFVTTMDQAKIFDFGLAIRLDEPSHTEGCRTGERRLADSTGGHSGLVGTPTYMSPEQMSGKRLDGRSDLFSLGVVLYEMLSGERPFQAVTTGFLPDMVLRQRSVPILKRRPELPAGIESVLRKALEKDRALRYATAAELCADLERLQRSLQHRRTNPAMAAVG